jgi:hypothetical protein
VVPVGLVPVSEGTLLIPLHDDVLEIVDMLQDLLRQRTHRRGNYLFLALLGLDLQLPLLNIPSQVLLKQCRVQEFLVLEDLLLDFFFNQLKRASVRRMRKSVL